METIFIILYTVIALILIFFTTIILRAVIKGKKPELPEELPQIKLRDNVEKRLSEFIQIPTVSHSDYALTDKSQFQKLEEKLQKEFPLTYQKLDFEKVGDYGLLFKWEGENKTLQPALFMAHYDVVPAENEGWDYPPFSGQITEKYIYGRGTLDIKQQLIAIFETIEQLLTENHKPQRTLYFAFGGDEEVSGKEGASKIVEILKARNLNFSFVMDEGGLYNKGSISFLGDKPIAVVGMAEKGTLFLNLKAKGKAGHSSQPPKHTAIGKLAGAIQALEANPYPLRIGQTFRDLIKALTPHSPFSIRLLLANQYIFSGLLKKVFSASDTTRPLLQTSQSVTMIEGGIKENTIPPKAQAVVNYRILPGDNIEKILKRTKKICKKYEVEVEISEFWPPNNAIPSSSTKTEQYQRLDKAIRGLYPESITTPYIMIGATDSHFYTDLTDNIFRFTPVTADKEDLKSIHGKNERVLISDYRNSIRFYHYFFKSLDEKFKTDK